MNADVWFFVGYVKVETYEDKDGAREDEIAALGGHTATGINVYSAFYDRLKEVCSLPFCFAFFMIYVYSSASLLLTSKNFFFTLYISLGSFLVERVAEFSRVLLNLVFYNSIDD